MKLPARLKSIVKLIPPGSIVADVGTDHAILPIYLVKEGIAAKVIAGDLNPGPLGAAEKNILAANATKRVILRQGYGLEIIKPGEVEIAVIAGMGGAVIKQIINSAGENVRLLKQLILQPMTGSGHLREWLADHGWRIEDEDLVQEDDRFYEIISAVPGCEETADRTVISIGPRLFAKKHPLLIDLLSLEIEKNKKIVADMEKSITRQTKAKKIRMQDKIRNLERISECLLNARL